MLERTSYRWSVSSINMIWRGNNTLSRLYLEEEERKIMQMEIAVTKRDSIKVRFLHLVHDRKEMGNTN